MILSQCSAVQCSLHSLLSNFKKKKVSAAAVLCTNSYLSFSCASSQLTICLPFALLCIVLHRIALLTKLSFEVGMRWWRLLRLHFLLPNLACMFASVFIFFVLLPKTQRVLALALFPSPTRHPTLHSSSSSLPLPSLPPSSYCRSRQWFC